MPAPRALTRALFHLPDVPVDLIEEDDARAGLTPANLGRAAMTPGIVAPEAAQIDCPLLLLYGEVDTSPDPHAEVGFYRACRDITLVVSAGIGSYAQLRIDAARWMAPASSNGSSLARLALRQGRFRKRGLHAQSRHELREIGADFGKRLAQKAGKQPHDRRIFSRRRGLPESGLVESAGRRSACPTIAIRNAASMS